MIRLHIYTTKPCGVVKLMKGVGFVGDRVMGKTQRIGWYTVQENDDTRRPINGSSLIDPLDVIPDQQRAVVIPIGFLNSGKNVAFHR